MNFKQDFKTQTIYHGDVGIHVRHAGSGPPLLLLHGYPQTGYMWHKIAPRLAETFSVVIPDLRGYGDSDKPPTDITHGPYSKRAMAADMVAVMRALGHTRFAVAGHDRGGRVAHRLARDHPTASAILRCLTSHQQQRCMKPPTKSLQLHITIGFSNPTSALSGDNDRPRSAIFLSIRPVNGDAHRARLPRQPLLNIYAAFPIQLPSTHPAGLSRRRQH